MDVINTAQIFMLLWSFTAVCQTDADGCGVRCHDVTGTVGNEVIFNCSVSEQMTKGCVTLQMFLYPENYYDPKICGKGSADGHCEKKNIFTCSYTPHTAMKETFSFFVQGGKSCSESKGFTVEISEPVEAGTPGRREAVKSTTPKAEALRINGTSGSLIGENPGSTGIPVVCFIIFIIVLILTIIVYKMHRGGFQNRKKLQAIRQNDDDNNKTENV